MGFRHVADLKLILWPQSPQHLREVPEVRVRIAQGRNERYVWTHEPTRGSQLAVAAGSAVLPGAVGALLESNHSG
jgi:hypothetical protein